MMTRNNYYAGVLSVLLGISLIAGTFPVNTYAAENVNYNNADITISSAEELVEFSKNAVADSYTEGKIIAITKDIDLTGVDFKPIAVLAGTLDGNGHVISGFSLTEASSESGFIGSVVSGASVIDLTVKGKIAPDGGAENIGGIAGVNNGFIKGCSFEGSLVANEAAGGIVGHNEKEGQIVGCENKGIILAKRRTGGVTGFNEGVVDSSRNSGSVNTIPQDDEHLAAYKDIDESADNSNLSKFNPDETDILNDDLLEKFADENKINYTGGIAGASAGIVRNSENSGDVGRVHLGYKSGGIVGYERGILYNCSNSGTIYGRKNVGGIVGQFEPYTENIYSEDSFDKSRDEMDKMNDLMDELNDLAQNADDETQGKIDDIRSTVDELRGTVSGYKGYYRSKDDITEGEIRSKVDALRNALDDIDLDRIETADYGTAIKADFDRILELLRQTEASASAGLSIDMSAYISALKKLNSDLASEIDQIKGVGNRIAKNAGRIEDGFSDALDASEALDDYLRDAYDSYKNDLRGTDDDINSKTDKISEEMDALSDSLKSSDRDIRNQMDKIVSEMNLLNDSLHDGFDEIDEELTRIQNTDSLDEIFDDVSDTQDTSPSKGKIVACVNNGYVNSDINGGGIAGFAGVDPDSQSDFEVVSGGQVSLKYTRTKQATITHCKNYGEVDVRNSYAGGIVARMETGAVIASENYGMIMTSDGDYTGGIAGYAANVIRDSYSMETLSGNDYIGGIAGLAEKLYNNKSMSEIEGDGERYGALAGMLEDDDNAEASGNIYVDYGRAAINGFTMSSQAKEVSYDELARMEDTPDDFGIMRVSFMDGDKRIAVIKRPYGGSISSDELPELPSEDGKLAIWDISGLDDIRQNIVVRASYVMPVTTIASDEPFPTMLVSGNFYKGSSILYEKYSAEGKDAEEPYECVDKYLFKINSSYGTADDNYTVRVRADSYKNWYKVATVQDGKIVPVPTGWDGKYMVFSMKGDGVFYIVRNKKHYIPCITAGIAILVLIVAVCIFRGLKK